MNISPRKGLFYKSSLASAQSCLSCDVSGWMLNHTLEIMEFSDKPLFFKSDQALAFLI